MAAGESPAAGGRLWTIADYFIKALPETNWSVDGLNRTNQQAL